MGRERAHVDDGTLPPRHHFSLPFFLQFIFVFATFFAVDFCFCIFFAPGHHGRKDRPGHAQHGVDVAVY